jgi:hypothetical protein
VAATGIDQGGRTSGAGTAPSPTDWRVLLLKAIGAPTTRANLDTLQAWALSESGYNAQTGTALAGPQARNPLAITDSFGVPSSGTVNSAGVLKFGSTIAGVLATARFLKHGYDPVIQGFRDSSPEEVYQAVNQSGWCSGCQSGRYPVGLYNYVQSGKVQGGGQTFQGGGLSFSQAEALSSLGSSSGKTDTGGLFGYCKVTSSSVPLGPSIPTGGFGCYVSQSLVFAAVGFGGAVVAMLGAYLLVSPGMRSKILSVPLAGAGVAAGLGGLEAAGAAKAAAGAGQTARKGRLSDDERAQRDQHAAAQRRARIRLDRARARETEARAREAEGRARATSSTTRPTSSGRLAYETPGYD